MSPDMVAGIALIAFAVGVLFGAVPTYAAWQRDKDAQRAHNRRLAADLMLARLDLADATGHPSASVLPFERRTR